MKKILAHILAVVIVLAMIGCSEEDPQFRIRNERLDKANVQIQTSGGNTVNINDVASGQTTAYSTVAEGNTAVTAVIQNESVSPSAKFNCEMDERYTVVLQTGNPPTIRIDN
ncbi:MAG: hypothetical protein WCW35_02015 [Bacteroidota bacterium]|jgi:hypothetical protein